MVRGEQLIGSSNLTQLQMVKHTVKEEMQISEVRSQRFPWSNLGKEEQLFQKMESERNQQLQIIQ